MTAIAVQALLSQYDEEQESDEGMTQWVVDLGFRKFLTRADIEEDFNVMQDYITASLESDPFI